MIYLIQNPAAICFYTFHLTNSIIAKRFTLFYCFQGKQLPASLYSSDWVHCSNDYKQLLLIAMMNMQRELYVRVGGIVNFSLDTLVVVSKSRQKVMSIRHSLLLLGPEVVLVVLPGIKQDK